MEADEALFCLLPLLSKWGFAAAAALRACMRQCSTVYAHAAPSFIHRCRYARA